MNYFYYGGPGRVGTPVDLYEPDNSRLYANSIASGSPQTHTIFPIADVDWVKFYLFDTSDIEIETSGPGNDDTRLWLYS